MGFFTKPDAAPAPALGPLTRERLTAVLDEHGVNYGQDDDGDVYGYWDGHLFFFFQYGREQEYLQVRGRWNRKLGHGERYRLMGLANDWNSQKLWPKVYVREEGDHPGLYGEITVDYEPGVTDAQIYQQISCAIGTSLELFDHLDEQYPEAAAAAKAELGTEQG